ncbi:MAG: Nif3-like dinuclear metal center hexameric protein [Gemmatimonadales bacterium]|nr:MAG: Nif3-like dinuclear metal center hexameric protein [Gemmatimonadales bacterium]
MIESKFVFAFLDGLLAEGAEQDYPGALNGLQVEGPEHVGRVGAAVDASENVIARAVEESVDLLLVHHGLFWDSERRITGRRFRKLDALIRGGIGVYSSHLPLDRHPEVGNSALLMRALGLEPAAEFGEWKGQTLGWQTSCDLSRTTLGERLGDAVGGPVRVFDAGPDTVRTLAVVTGAGASFLAEAAASGVDTLITGEAPHHAFHDARELGVNLMLAGHYLTETWGVRAVASRLEKEFGLPWVFLDDPSGL